MKQVEEEFNTDDSKKLIFDWSITVYDKDYKEIKTIRSWK